MCNVPLVKLCVVSHILPISVLLGGREGLFQLIFQSSLDFISFM